MGEQRLDLLQNQLNIQTAHDYIIRKATNQKLLEMSGYEPRGKRMAKPMGRGVFADAGFPQCLLHRAAKTGRLDLIAAWQASRVIRDLGHGPSSPSPEAEPTPEAS